MGESKIATLRELSATSPEFTAEARLVNAAPRDLEYPFILKPDVGQRGVGVKLIRHPQQAEEYLAGASAALIAQRYAPGSTAAEPTTARRNRCRQPASDPSVTPNAELRP